MDHDQTLALVALLRHSTADAPWRTIAPSVRELGAVEVLDRLHPPTLLDPDPTAELLRRAEHDLDSWARTARVLTVLDGAYPAQLRHVPDAPPVLFTRGTLAADRGACIIGSRQAPTAALQYAADVARRLAARHIPVISGLAAGIDTAAHTAALAAGGRTIAVIGTGIDHTYPATNTQLQQQIAIDGLVLSQFWPGTGPTRHAFPLRNATMSAYGACTLIVAASEVSGTRIQARHALAQRRPLLLTRQVAEHTQWGHTLAATHADVHVVNSAEHAAESITRLIAPRQT